MNLPQYLFTSYRVCYRIYTMVFFNVYRFQRVVANGDEKTVK